MTNERKHTRDAKLLSAYLDDALSLRARRKLEARLAQDPDLQGRLEQLRQTRRLLAHLPRVSAPRNFTLSPAMVTVRGRRQPLFSHAKLASALASLLLVVLVGAELVLGGGLFRMAATPTQMEAASIEEDVGEPTPLILWGGERVEGKGGGGDEVTRMMEAPEESEKQAVPEEESLETFVEKVEDREGDLILGLNPDQEGEIVTRSQPAQAAEEAPSQGLSPLRWAEMGLAVIALVAGVIWLLSKR